MRGTTARPGHVFLAGDARTQSGLYDDAMPETEHADCNDPLEHMLQRSEALHERFNELLDDAEFDGSPRGATALGMCLVVNEQATALHAIDGAGHADISRQPDAAAVQSADPRGVAHPSPATQCRWLPRASGLEALRNSNGLRTMIAMMMAILTGDEAITKPMSKAQPAFADCPPDLLKP